MRRRAEPKHCTNRRKPIESDVRIRPSFASCGARLYCVSCARRTCDLRRKSQGDIEMAYTVFGAANDRWIPFIVMAVFVTAVAAGVLVPSAGTASAKASKRLTQHRAVSMHSNLHEQSAIDGIDCRYGDPCSDCGRLADGGRASRADYVGARRGTQSSNSAQSRTCPGGRSGSEVCREDSLQCVGWAARGS